MAENDTNVAALTGPGVFGVVSDSAGLAVAGASVTLISSAGEQVSRTVSGPDGFYHLAAHEPDTCVVIVSAEGWDPEAATVELAETPVASDIVLAGAVGLAGTVLRARDGAPVAGATVAVLDPEGAVLTAGATDFAGRFGVVGIDAGEYVLAVSASGYQPGALGVRVAGPETTMVEICLFAGVRLAGVVFGPDGEPVAEAQVTLTEANGTIVDTLTTGLDGRYRFEQVEQGDYRVIASGYGPQTVDVAVGDTDLLEIDFTVGHAPISFTPSENTKEAAWSGR